MFRSGDPAVKPPHKFHLLVNMRRTPGGLITRPGLELEYDTGIEECIDGLTEDAGLQGGALMLYPGAEVREGPPDFHPATFRAIFPDSSDDYSEYAFALYGPAATVRGDMSPVLAYSVLGSGYPGPTFLSRPFIFRGQAVQFALVDSSGTDTVALLGINLPERSFLQASDCWRDASRPNDGDTPACPGAAGQPTPPGDDPPLWPFQHPVGSVGVLAYFDNPFTTGDWTPDAASAADDKVVDLILTRQERIDDILTGTAGVSEVLYFVALQDELGTLKRRLIRWDGVQQTTEFATIPDDLRPALTDQAYGPVLVAGDEDGDIEDWAALRGEDGTWTVIGGSGWTVDAAYTCPPGATADTLDTAAYHPRAVSWGGKGHLIVYGLRRMVDVTCSTLHAYIFAMPQGATEFAGGQTDRSCSLTGPAGDDNPERIPIDVVVQGHLCYAIVSTSDDDLELCVGDFLTPLSQRAQVRLCDLASSAAWIQAVASRVYVGGKFGDTSPLGLSEQHHGVYDVTDPDAIFAVYLVADSEQQEDSGGNEADRYSRGALPAVPNDDTGGQGFQAS